MARSRSTVEVKPLKDQLNARIANSKSEEARKQLCEVLESVLHGANAYNGFHYLDGWDGIEDYRHFYY